MIKGATCSLHSQAHLIRAHGPWLVKIKLSKNDLKNREEKCQWKCTFFLMWILLIYLVPYQPVSYFVPEDLKLNQPQAGTTIFLVSILLRSETQTVWMKFLFSKICHFMFDSSRIRPSGWPWFCMSLCWSHQSSDLCLNFKKKKMRGEKRNAKSGI